ncbi:hypothetical protein DMB42_06955 [Nonomuraea sp. WAC 01424]|uniref:hypothetical protein n=1 Tax=Nonomuraea sp. WAC 01424 TaxID=2203200 RepID=UPI000F7B6A0C|nr:hypothetical protein [Nonomuraea sp. WAC 01424]RSN14267.1 hypothetical protein DMB42_06955 [Nonomuraea sp. WAC 01424]
MTSIIRTSLAGITLAGITSLGLIAPGAAPAGASTSTTLGNVPGCVAVWRTTGWVRQTGHARNDCGSRIRMRIDWAFGPDGSCRTVDPGRTLTSRVPKAPRRFNGAVYC